MNALTHDSGYWPTRLDAALTYVNQYLIHYYDAIMLDYACMRATDHPACVGCGI